MTIQRVKSWDVYLVSVLDQYRRKSFEWGLCDCTTLMRDCLTALIGHFESPTFTYHDIKSALVFAKLHDTQEFLIKNLDAKPVKPGFQQRGDIILVKQHGFWCAHVCMGRLSWSAWEGRGVFTVNTRELLKSHKTTILRVGG